MPPKKSNATKGKKSDPKTKKLEMKTKKTASKQPKQTKKTPATRLSKKVPATGEYKPEHCVVVFSNGECELFKSEDEARIQRQSLPAGMVKEFKLCPTVGHAKNFIKVYVSNAEDKDDTEKPIVSSTNAGGLESKHAAVTPEKKKSHTAFLQSISSPGQNKSSRFGQVLAEVKGPNKPVNSVRSAFLNSISQSAHCVNTVLRVFVIKFNAENQVLPVGYKIPTKQVIVLDVFDQNKNATYWTHKPKTWVNMFKTAEATDKSLFDGECYLLHNFQFRDLTSKHKAEPKFYKYQTSKGGTMNIPVEACFALVPITWTNSNILGFAVKIGKNMMKSHAKEAYGLYYPTASSNYKNSIDSVTGEYWKTMEAVFRKGNIMIAEKEALSEIFSNDLVLEIMAEVFQDNRKPEDWNDELRMMYAFKNLLDLE